MSMQQEGQHPVLYQADPNIVPYLQSIRDRIHHICNAYVNRHVRVQMLDGSIIEGVIVQCDKDHVYLSVGGHHGQRQLFGPGPFSPYPLYGPGSVYAGQQAILTLVLYELLVIALLS